MTRVFLLLISLIPLVDFPLFAGELEYFPMQIGNRWEFVHYRCTEYGDAKQISIHETITPCIARDEAVTYEMSVTDTIRINREPIQAFTSGIHPPALEEGIEISEDGIQYYVLEGSFLPILFGTNESINKAIVRQTDSSVPVIDPYCGDTIVQNDLSACIKGGWDLTTLVGSSGISFAAVYLDDLWKLFPVDRPLIYLGDEIVFWTLSETIINDDNPWLCWGGSWILGDDSDRYLNHCEFGGHGWLRTRDMSFARGIGATSLKRDNGDTWDLVKANINGTEYHLAATLIRNNSWAQIKQAY